jgi:phosphoglycerol transferase
VTWLLWTIAAVSAAIAMWIRFRFGNVGLEMILSNLPTNGFGAGNSSLVTEGVLFCLVLPVSLVAALVGGRWAWLRRKRAAHDTTGRAEPPRSGRRLRIILPVMASMVSLTLLLTVAGIPQFAVAMLGNRSFEQYVALPQVDRPAQPKNLITIYLESMETTFSDEEIFGENLLAGLDAATQGWSSVDAMAQYPGGGWTMAGIIGSQCGIPLKSRLLLPTVNPNDFGEKLEEYLPGATCLGDVLGDAGYTNTYVGGADISFAGKGTFLASHGYTSILGREYWQDQGEPEENISEWGLSDHRTFAHAEQVVTDLRASGEPFNLTILTLDTHEPGGVFPTCATDDDVAMATAIKCSMKAVADFIGFLETEGFLDDTVVMLMGDHLKATSDGGFFKQELEAVKDRSIVFRVHSPEPVTFDRQEADQFSILPTTLELLGFSLVDGRAGLGVSLVGGHDLAGTVLELDAPSYYSTVTAPSSDFYMTLWQDADASAEPDSGEPSDAPTSIQPSVEPSDDVSDDETGGNPTQGS